MSYTKTNWENLPSTNTPVNASNLNKIEDEIKEHDDLFKENYFTTIGATTGKYLDSDGNQVSNNAWSFTNYIRIEANQQYSISNNGVAVGNLPAICFYTKNKAFISGEQLGGGYNKIVKAPSNAEYARLSYASANYKFIKIDSNEIYSTEEQKIGTWIDGKPLYRKVIETTSPSSVDTNTNIYTFTENIKNVVNIYGYLYYQQASYNGSINCYITNQDYIATWVLVNSNGIPTNIRCRQHNRVSAPMKIILEYTKTTD